MLTEAEKHFDALVDERRAKGRATYGRGLTHTDDYDWTVMALEEAMDLSQYLAAENLRLRDRLAAVESLSGGPWATWTHDAREAVVLMVRATRDELRASREAAGDLPHSASRITAVLTALDELELLVHPDLPRSGA